jgi:hypothetical protein
MTLGTRHQSAWATRFVEAIFVEKSTSWLVFSWVLPA